MRKIITFLLISVSFFMISADNIFAGNCKYDDGTISSELENCLSDSALVGTDKSAEIGAGFDSYILGWVSNISLYLGFFAVLSIVIGGLMLTLSAGDDEKVNKAKGIVKWGIIGFLGIISAASIITILVKVFYSI